MRAVIIGSGEIKNYDYIKGKIQPDDFIICADGGYNHAQKMGILPDVLLGDFDSATDFENVKGRIVYPTRKDFTDGELAVTYAVEHGFEDVVLFAMSGNRLDHTITDILLLDKCKNGVLIDDNNEVYLVKDRLKLIGKKGQTVSIIPINSEVCGIKSSGLEYPLCDDTLYFGCGRGVSNVMTEDECTITIKSGTALVIKVEKV